MEVGMKADFVPGSVQRVDILAIDDGKILALASEQARSDVIYAPRAGFLQNASAVR
jgi:hypothetical protein